MPALQPLTSSPSFSLLHSSLVYESKEPSAAKVALPLRQEGTTSRGRAEELEWATQKPGRQQKEPGTVKPVTGGLLSGQRAPALICVVGVQGLGGHEQVVGDPWAWGCGGG